MMAPCRAGTSTRLRSTTTGLAIVAGGLWQISGATATSGYAGIVLAGAGVGLVLPAATDSVIDLGLVAGALVVLGGALVALFVLPTAKRQHD